MILKNDYPSEHFVPLDGEPYLIGRLILNKVHNGLSVEIDIVQKEGLKIFKSIDRLYGIESDHEAIDLGVQKLSEFLKSLS
ncbi:MAG: hypothetical protein NXH75_05150 [Halobacteriovoraceae bacterium]|nr:hypothetical protein [Halobacteriovoraceae bacterium]